MYYIIEHDKKPDGSINVSEIGRATEATARSYYFERYSKMLVTEQFKSVALMLVDEDLNVLIRHIVETQYKEPVIETDPEEKIPLEDDIPDVGEE